MEVKVDVGRRIKEQRQRLNLTLKEIEARVEVSATHISEIERGKTSPTVGALKKIARALQTHSALFLAHPDLPDASVVRGDARSQIRLDDEACTLRPLSGGVAQPELSVMMISWDAGASPKVPRQHEGEEFGLILSGRLRIQLGESTYDLGAGETIHFPADVPHVIYNPDDEPCNAIWATSPRFGF